MPINELLLSEFDEEMKKTRHHFGTRSRRQKRLRAASQVDAAGQAGAARGELAGFGVAVLTTPELDFSTGSRQALAVRVAGATGQSFR